MPLVCVESLPVNPVPLNASKQTLLKLFPQEHEYTGKKIDRMKRGTNKKKKIAVTLFRSIRFCISRLSVRMDLTVRKIE